MCKTNPLNRYPPTLTLGEVFKFIHRKDKLLLKRWNESISFRDASNSQRVAEKAYKYILDQIFPHVSRFGKAKSVIQLPSRDSVPLANIFPIFKIYPKERGSCIPQAFEFRRSWSFWNFGRDSRASILARQRRVKKLGTSRAMCEEKFEQYYSTSRNKGKYETMLPPKARKHRRQHILNCERHFPQTSSQWVQFPRSLQVFVSKRFQRNGLTLARQCAE